METDKISEICCFWNTRWTTTSNQIILCSGT